MRVLGILLCAGSASRMGFDKLATPLVGKTAVVRSGEALAAGGCTELVLTAGAGDADYLSALDFPLPHRVVAGGATRQNSVLNALLACALDGAGSPEDIAVIHDAARCMVTADIVRRCVDSAREFGSGIAAARATDTVLRQGLDGAVSVVPRDQVLLMQTPQCFRFQEILLAYETLRSPATDDCTLYAAAGHKPRFVPCPMDNFKLTAPADWARAERILTRYGTGYDTHRLVEGRKLVLGGVTVPYEKGLLGHSDADVLLHAVMDALLGAAALGDIGKHFPDTDPAYEGADSMLLLTKCRELLVARSLTPVSVDATVIAQRPRLAPYIDEMRRNIADALGIPVDAASVKATTTEGMNDEGRGLCISAMAVASLR